MTTSKLASAYGQVWHDHFEKARIQGGRSLRNHLGDSFHSAASTVRSAFAWRWKPAVQESETAKANRIIDELDGYFKPTLKCKRNSRSEAI